MPKLKMDSALFRAMSRLGDLLLLNLLWVVCSLPLVTAGAAATGLLYAARRMLTCEDYNPRKDFLRAFQRNFRQATALWLLLAGAAALFVFDLYIAFHTPGALGNLLRGTGLVLCLLWLALWMPLPSAGPPLNKAKRRAGGWSRSRAMRARPSAPGRGCAAP